MVSRLCRMGCRATACRGLNIVGELKESSPLPQVSRTADVFEVFDAVVASARRVPSGFRLVQDVQCHPTATCKRIQVFAIQVMCCCSDHVCVKSCTLELLCATAQMDYRHPPRSGGTTNISFAKSRNSEEVKTPPSPVAAQSPPYIPHPSPTTTTGPGLHKKTPRVHDGHIPLLRGDSRDGPRDASCSSPPVPLPSGPWRRHLPTPPERRQRRRQRQLQRTRPSRRRRPNPFHPAALMATPPCPPTLPVLLFVVPVDIHLSTTSPCSCRKSTRSTRRTAPEGM